MLCNHGIHEADQCFLVSAGKILNDTEPFQESVIMNGSRVGGAAGQQVIDRDAEEFSEKNEFIRRRRMQAHFIFVELCRVNTELCSNFLLRKIFLFPQGFEVFTTSGSDISFAGRNQRGCGLAAGAHRPQSMACWESGVDEVDHEEYL
jgi:hypothetical protein